VTGQRLTLVYELRDDVVGATTTVAPSEEDLLARLVTEFDAEELPVPDDSVSQKEGE
jgi:hypothetical protein